MNLLGYDDNRLQMTSQNAPLVLCFAGYFGLRIAEANACDDDDQFQVFSVCKW